MSFDLSNASLPAAADEGVFMSFTGSDGLPLTDEAKRPIGVTLRYRLSREVQAKQRDITNRRLEQNRRGKDPSAEQLEAEQTEVLVAATVGWSIDELDSAPFHHSAENAQRLWSDPRFRHFREQANVFLSDLGNFTTG